MKKRLFAMILSFALVLCCCACGETLQDQMTGDPRESTINENLEMQSTTSSTESFDSNTVNSAGHELESTENDITEETSPTRVSADHQEDYIPTGDIVASVVDAINETYTIDQTEYSRILPRIELPGPNVEAINEEILRDYTTDFYTVNYTNIYYRWAVKEDILSVVIIGGGSMFDGGWEGYGCDAFSVYNISISKCRLLSDEEVYSCSGLENIKSSVLNAIVRYGAEWKGREEEGRKQFYSKPNDSMQIASISENLSDENFEKARPYFDENGNLHVMGFVVTNIGAGGFYGFVPVYKYEEDTLLSAEEYYNYYYQLYSD